MPKRLLIGQVTRDSSPSTRRVEVARLVKRLESVQSTLGDQHDSLVARGELPQLAQRAATDGVDVYALGMLHVRLEERAAAAEAAFEKVWRQASKKKRRSWLT